MPVELDPMEDQLLESLEDLAQKADVLTHWADEMYEGVKAIPQSWCLWLIEHCLYVYCLVLQNPYQIPTSSCVAKERQRNTLYEDEMPFRMRSVTP